jgi:hypothetical protein
MFNFQHVPERISFLILLYIHQALTPQQHDELDAWVEESDENMRAFEDLSDVEPMISYAYN